MEARAKFLGHAIHPILIVFPLGLLITSVIFDIIGKATDNTEWSLISFYMIGAGVLGGLLAAVFGTIDWLGIPRQTRAWRIGLVHGLGNVVVVALFAGSWMLRRGDPTFLLTSAFALSVAGVLLGAVTAWLGGELVERMGVGVSSNASLDAPSSLSGEAARPELRTRK